MIVEIVLHIIELAGIAFLVGAKYCSKNPKKSETNPTTTVERFNSDSIQSFVASQHVICKKCGRTVARYNSDGVCLNCASEV